MSAEPAAPEPDPNIQPTSWPHSPTFGPIPTFVEGVYNGTVWFTHVESAVDWLGNRFRIGDQVLYCISAGRGQAMAVGTVQAIRAREKHNYNHDGATKARTVVGWEFEVQVLTLKTSGAWSNKKRTKPAWVNPMNITSLSVATP